MAITPLSFQNERLVVGDDDEFIEKMNRVFVKLDSLVDQINALGGPPINKTGVTAEIGGDLAGAFVEVDSAPRLGTAEGSNVGIEIAIWNSSSSSVVVTTAAGVSVLGSRNIGPGQSVVAKAVRSNVWILLGANTGSSSSGSVNTGGGTDGGGGGGSGRESDAYTQNMGSPVINRADRDSSGVVRVYYGPQTSGPYPAGTAYEVEIGGIVYNADDGGYRAIPNAPAGNTAILRAVNASAMTRSADVSRAIASI